MPEEDEVSLYDYIKVVSKWKWFIIIGTFVCILTAGIVTLLLPKVYETRATLAMQGSVTPDVEIGILTVPTGLSLDKFVSSLPNNRDLNLEVIRNLGLDKSPDELTPQALSQTVTFSLAKDSRTIAINVRYGHSQKAKDIADTMAEVMKERYQVLNETEISQSQNLIDEQLNLAQTRLLEAEENLEVFKETVDVDSLKKEIQSRVSQETSLTQEYSKITMFLVEEEAGLARAQGELEKQDRFYVLSKSIVEDAAYGRILDKLSKEDIAALQGVKGESQQINPVYRNLEQIATNARISIARAKAKKLLVKERIEENRVALSKLQTQLAEREGEWEHLTEAHDLAKKLLLKAKIEENKVALSKLQDQLAEKEPEWETLTEGYNRTREEYQSIRSAHQGAVKLLAAAKTRQLKTVGTAGVPSKPIEPNTKRILLIAAAVGLLAVLFLAFFLEYLAKMKKLETESKKQDK